HMAVSSTRIAERCIISKSKQTSKRQARKESDSREAYLGDVCVLCVDRTHSTAGERPIEQRTRFVRKLQRLCRLLSARRHLRPGLAQDAEHLLGVMTGCEFAQLMLEKYQARRIFEQLRFRIELELLLAQQAADARDGVVVVTGRSHDAGC